MPKPKKNKTFGAKLTKILRMRLVVAVAMMMMVCESWCGLMNDIPDNSKVLRIGFKVKYSLNNLFILIVNLVSNCQIFE